MHTEVINSEDQSSYEASLKRAADALRDGALVVFPTETVYGVAANAAHSDAVARLRKVKGRAFKQPFTTHLAARRDAEAYIGRPSPLIRRLARKAWPGPLTMICGVSSPETQAVARQCSAEQLAEIYRDGRVGLRCPDHHVATRLLREAGIPAVASSANRAGQPAPNELSAALDEIGGEVEFAIDAGRTTLSSASTIVEVDRSEWAIRRKGALDERTIRRLARSEFLMVCTGNSCRSPMAEYMFRHELAEKLGLSLEELANEGYYTSSCGTFGYSGSPISEGSLRELANRGMDARAHTSQPLTVELIQRAERIYAMSPEHRAAVIDLVPSASERTYLLDEAGPIADPVGGGPAEYRQAALHIEAAVAKRVEEFIDDDRNWQ